VIVLQLYSPLCCDRNLERMREQDCPMSRQTYTVLPSSGDRIKSVKTLFGPRYRARGVPK